jgi:hypothetical protein
MRKAIMRIPSTVRDDSFVRLHYVRYADDFIMGVEGSAAIAKEVLSKLEAFVSEKLKLQFNPEKTGIINYSKKPVEFLGYTIQAPHLKGITKPYESVVVDKRRITRRKKIRIRIYMNQERVIKRLLNRGMIKRRVSHKKHKELILRGTFMGNLINLDHADIIRYYNSVIRGLYNYYDFVRNRLQLLRII